MKGIDPSLLYEFVEEAREHLASVENDFMQLEKDPEHPDSERINRVFRAVHTVKGSSGFFNLVAIGKLAHQMETLLSLFRDGSMVPSADMIDALLAGVDLLNTMLDDVNQSNAMDISATAERITAFIGTSKQSLPTIGQSEGELVEFEKEALSKLQPGEFLYELVFNLTDWEKASRLSPVHLVSELSQVGVILDGKLEIATGNFREKIPEGNTYYHLYFKTVAEPDLITGITEIAPDRIRNIVLSGNTHPEEMRDVNAAQNVSVSEMNELHGPAMETTQKQPSEASDTLRVRVDILNKLMMLAGELVLVRNQQLLQQDRTDSASRAITQRLDIVTTDLQETIMRTRMQPIGNVFSRFTRIVRDLSKKLNKEITIATSGTEVELDKNILEALVDPLTHIIRNSCDHGIEIPQERSAAGKRKNGIIRLNAYHEGGQINIQIIDDGRGISLTKLKEKALEKGFKSESELTAMSDKELLSLIFLPGLSTAVKVGDMSGRGVGMDVVKTSVEQLGGVIEIDSEADKGTTLNLRLPLTLAIIPSLIVQVGGERFAIPQVNLEELVCLYDEDVLNKIECVGNREVYRLRNNLLTMVRLNELLAQPEQFDENVKGVITTRNHDLRLQKHAEWKAARKENKPYPWSLNFAVLKVGAFQFGLIIDSILGTEEIVVKPMHRAVKDLSIYSGATVLGDGSVALILDVLGLARHAVVTTEEDDNRKMAAEDLEITDATSEEKRSLLVFSNKGDERFAMEMGGIKRVERLNMTEVERVGEREFITIDGTSTRIVRLDECLPIARGGENSEMFLILPKQSEKPYGVLASELIDIGEFSVDLNTESFSAPGVEGSAILQNHMTLLLESDKLAGIAEPEWYNKQPEKEGVA